MPQRIHAVLPWTLLCCLLWTDFGHCAAMTHSLGRGQLSDFWYTAMKQEFSLASATTAKCTIEGNQHKGEIFPSSSSSYYLPDQVFYAISSPSVQNVSDKFTSDGTLSFDLSSSSVLKSLITEPIEHVRVKVVESNCVYMLAFLSSLTDIHLEYVSLTQDVRLARSNSKISENANQSLFQSDLLYPKGQFLILHKPTSVHKNLHILCVGFSEMAAKLKIEVDFKIRIIQPEEEPHPGPGDGATPNPTGPTENPGTTPNPTEPTENPGTTPNPTPNNVETPPGDDVVQPIDNPETKPEITKEEITPKTSDDLKTLDSTQEDKFIENVISYFEEKEKDNVIVIAQGQTSTDGGPKTDVKSIISDKPDGNGKEIITVQTLNTEIQPRSSKLIEIKKVTQDIELELKQDLAFSVYVKDTQSEHHFIKTQDQPLPSKRISRQQDDYTIQELFVRIENNSDTETSADLNVKFIETLEKTGSFFTKYWYILLIICLTVLILTSLVVYLKCWKKRTQRQTKININIRTSETLDISTPGSHANFLPTLERNSEKVFFQKNINNFAMIESKLQVSSIAYRE